MSVLIAAVCSHISGLAGTACGSTHTLHIWLPSAWHTGIIENMILCTGLTQPLPSAHGWPHAACSYVTLNREGVIDSDSYAFNDVCGERLQGKDSKTARGLQGVGGVGTATNGIRVLRG